MEKFSRHPAFAFRVAAQLVAVLRHLRAPLGVFAEVGDHFVILVEQGDPRAQVGHEHHVTVDVNVRREDETIERLEVLAVEIEPLEALVRAVAHDDGGRASGPVVEVNAVRRVELTVAFAGLTEHREPLPVLVVAMDAIRAVAVGEEKSAVGREGVVRGHEGVAAPALLRRGVFVLEIDARVHRRVFFPDGFAFERELRETLHLLIRGDVEKLFLALGDDFQPMPAALKLISKRADKFPLLIEHEDGRMLLQVLAPLVRDVEQAVAIHRDVVRDLPRVFVRQLRPMVLHLVTMLARANDELRVRLLRREHARHGERSGGSGRGGGKETAASDERLHKMFGNKFTIGNAWSVGSDGRRAIFH